MRKPTRGSRPVRGRSVLRIRIGSAFALLTLVLIAFPVMALPPAGPFELFGSISSQELIRMRDVDQYDLVQQRNTAKIRFEYNMLDRGKLMDRFEIPFIDRSRLFLLYRGVYDSVYDLTPGFPQKDIWGQSISQRLDDLPNRQGLRFENQLREAYVDVALKQLPLSLRLGRQQIVWGETDNFRLLDRVNALDLTWHLQQESWDEIRTPYWMIKGLYQIGDIGPVTDAFFEFYWNPGDWYPANRDFLPRPWSAPIRSPLTPLVSLFGTGELAYDTQLFKQGNYARDPGDNSQVGTRVSAVTPQGIQFTLNYFYQRWAGDDGTNAAAYRALGGKEGTDALARGQLPIEAIAPYVHTIGASFNYAEQTYTQAVFRGETVYEMGVPFTDASKPAFPNNPALSQDLFGVSKRDMWKGMLAFDRPTWIRPLNRNSTFLILGQFFWHYLLDNPDVECRIAGEGPPCPSGQKSGFRGQFSDGRGLNAGASVIDKVRDWEVLTTLAATTFYSGGKLVPLFVYILDPMNKFNMEVLWQADYFVTNNLILNISQRYFINTTREPVYEAWGVAGINRGRSETGVRITYQF